MGDVGEHFRDVRQHFRELKAKHGIDCPGCVVARPKATPTRMLPGQKCKVCGHVDPRPRLPQT